MTIRTPWPYWLDHLLVAAAISLVLQEPLAGALFYAGREVRDREKLGRWDWPGLLAPVVPLTLLEIYLRLA